MTGERQIIGTCTCHDCKASVEVRIDKKGRAYANCDGRVDSRLCYATRKWSLPTSIRMVAEYETAQAAPEPAKPVKDVKATGGENGRLQAANDDKPATAEPKRTAGRNRVGTAFD